MSPSTGVAAEQALQRSGLTAFNNPGEAPLLSRLSALLAARARRSRVDADLADAFSASRKAVVSGVATADDAAQLTQLLAGECGHRVALLCTDDR